METTSSNRLPTLRWPWKRQLNKTNTLYGCSKTLNGTNEVFLRPFGWLLKETGSMLNVIMRAVLNSQSSSLLSHVNGEATSIEGDIASLLVVKTINNILNPIANNFKC